MAKFKVGDLVYARDYGGEVFEAEVMSIFNRKSFFGLFNCAKYVLKTSKNLWIASEENVFQRGGL